MRKGTAPVVIALATMIGAIVASFVLTTPRGTVVGPKATQAFLDAWQRSQQGTFVVEYRFTRVVAGGRGFEGKTRLAQRPPDRLFVGLGTVDGRIDGHKIDCATEPGGDVRCFPGATVGAYDDEVAREIDRLRHYVEGDLPLYRTSWTWNGCFALALARNLPAAQYGMRATFCFDDRTGAQVLVEVVRPEGTDRSIATSLRAGVTDSDFELPEDAGELPA